MVEFDTSKVELGELAKAMASVKAAGGEELPSAFLMVHSRLGKEQQDGILKAMAGVKGVDAKKSRVDGDRLDIALDNNGGAKFSELIEAVKSALPKK